MISRKRKLLIEVECGDNDCGPCEMEREAGDRSYCGIWGPYGRRPPECLAAEQPEPEAKETP